jgi:hypothetical protein
MDTRRATEGPADILNSMSRNPTERNADGMRRSVSSRKAGKLSTNQNALEVQWRKPTHEEDYQ